jgi:hypothetical protein
MRRSILLIAVLACSGGVAAPAFAQKTAPAVTRDTDRDGVPDIRDRCRGTPANTRVDERGCPVAAAPTVPAAAPAGAAAAPAGAAGAPSGAPVTPTAAPGGLRPPVGQPAAQTQQRAADSVHPPAGAVIGPAGAAAAPTNPPAGPVAGAAHAAGPKPTRPAPSGLPAPAGGAGAPAAQPGVQPAGQQAAPAAGQPTAAPGAGQPATTQPAGQQAAAPSGQAQQQGAPSAAHPTQPTQGQPAQQQAAGQQAARPGAAPAGAAAVPVPVPVPSGGQPAREPAPQAQPAAQPTPAAAGFGIEPYSGHSAADMVSYTRHLTQRLDSAVVALVDVFRNTSGAPLSGASGPSVLSSRERGRWSRCRILYFDLETYSDAAAVLKDSLTVTPETQRVATVLASALDSMQALAECDNIGSMIEAPDRWSPWQQNYESSARRFYRDWYAQVRTVHEADRALARALNAALPAARRIPDIPGLPPNPPYFTGSAR